MRGRVVQQLGVNVDCLSPRPAVARGRKSEPIQGGLALGELEDNGARCSVQRSRARGKVECCPGILYPLQRRRKLDRD